MAKTDCPLSWMASNLNVIGRAELIVNKRACGRPKDIADAETLDPTDP